MIAAVLARPSDLSARACPSPPHLTLNTSLTGTPVPIKNKHVPYCSPGPLPEHGLLSPPLTPPSRRSSFAASEKLGPLSSRDKLSDTPPVYAITAAELADALEYISRQPLPEPREVFPWLHGLHDENPMQLAFFIGRRRSLRRTPRCLRSLTIVKAGGKLGFSKLKGAISPDEILGPVMEVKGMETAPQFHDCDPKFGFSVRNFQIQTCKMATVSDVVVYGDDTTPRSEVEALARLISQAQEAWEDRMNPCLPSPKRFNTFVVTEPFANFETHHPEIIAVDSMGTVTGKVMDFFAQERLEMKALTEASEIAPNVWLGQTPDPSISGMQKPTPGSQFDVLIETSDFAKIPEEQDLPDVETFLNESRSEMRPAQLEFPASGSMTSRENSDNVVDSMVKLCRWIYSITRPSEGAASVESNPVAPRRVLIHCTDGYTESSLLALAYLMFFEQVPAHEAWVRLHRDKKRDFFAYPADKRFLERYQDRLIQALPRSDEQVAAAIERPLWLTLMDGSLPSRILPYLYLGNLTHAINPGLLKELGVTQILSVGEPIRWDANEINAWGSENFLFVDKVQDNGVDPLTNDFDRCLSFIQKARCKGSSTLVHCRVGVSRSATICIAEVMKELAFSFPRAYCFVRARRLNVIIQPHLRFSYELLKWEERQSEKRGIPFQRELEWASIAREIALMNKPYCQQ